MRQCLTSCRSDLLGILLKSKSEHTVRQDRVLLSADGKEKFGMIVMCISSAKNSICKNGPVSKQQELSFIIAR